MSSTRLIEAQNQINEIKVVMIENVELVIKRGEALSSLEEKSAILSDEATRFHRGSQHLRCKFLCKNLKWTVVILLLLIAVLLILLTIGCGGFGWPSCT